MKNTLIIGLILILTGSVASTTWEFNEEYQGTKLAEDQNPNEACPQYQPTEEYCVEIEGWGSVKLNGIEGQQNLLDMYSGFGGKEMTPSESQTWLDLYSCYQDGNIKKLSDCDKDLREQPSNLMDLSEVSFAGGSSKGEDSSDDELTGNQISEGFYRITNVDTNRELEVRNPNGKKVTEEGLDVQQWEAEETDLNENQIWYIDEPSGEGYRFINLASNLVMEVGGASNDEGSDANVQQWYWNGGDWQRFEIIEVNGGEYKINPLHNEGKVLEVEGGTDENRATIFQHSDDEKDHQRWFFQSVDDQVEKGSIEATESSNDGGDEELSASHISWEFKWKNPDDEQWTTINDGESIPNMADGQNNDKVDLRMLASTQEDAPELSGYRYRIDIDNKNAPAADDPDPQTHICRGDGEDAHECYGPVGGSMTQDLNAGGLLGDSTKFEATAQIQREKGESYEDIGDKTFTFKAKNGE